MQNVGLLFHRTMLLSGSGLSPWSLVSDPAKYAAIISHHVNCSPNLPYSQLMKCLRDQSLDGLLSTPIRQPDFGNAFGPSVDGVVIGKFNFNSIYCVNYSMGKEKYKRLSTRWHRNAMAWNKWRPE